MNKKILLIVIFFLYLIYCNYINIFENFNNLKLQTGKIITSKKELKNNTYQSYDGEYKSNPEKIYYPKNLKHIQNIIKLNKNNKIRVSGGQHTFNEISITNDIMIRTEKLKKILKIDKEKKQVTVESGITLGELNKKLNKYDLALGVLPAIPFQTIAGVLATSSHGSSRNNGSMSSLIESITLVLSDGSIRKIKKGDKLFPAIHTNLGALGVVYSITLNCVEQFIVKHTRKYIPLSEFLLNWKKYLKKYNYIQAYCRPYHENLLCSVYFRESIPINKLKNKNKYLKDMKKEREFLPITKVKNKIDYGYLVLTKNEEAGFYTEIEVAINQNNLNNAIYDIINLLKKHKKEYNYKTDKPILIRFTRADQNSLLSMTADRDSVFLSTFNTNKDGKIWADKKLKRFYEEYENLLIDKYKGRPHFGKKHNLDKNKMEKIYGNNIEKFNKIRNILDPNRMFSNEYINRLLGR